MMGEGFPLPLKRPPFFPVFVALIGRGFGEDLRNVAAIQHIVGLGTVTLTYGIGKLAIGRAAAIVGGLVAAFSGGLLIYEHYLMTESTFTFLLSASVFLYLLGIKRDSTWAYLASGLAVGLATLNRPHAQMLLAIGPPIVLLHTRKWRPTLRAALLSSVVAAVVIVPWMVRNKLEHGAFTVAGAVGQNLIAQTAVFHYGNFVFYDAENPPNDPNPKRLQARKFIQARSDNKKEKPSVRSPGVGIHARLMEELKPERERGRFIHARHRYRRDQSQIVHLATIGLRRFPLAVDGHSGSARVSLEALGNAQLATAIQLLDRSRLCWSKRPGLRSLTAW